MNEYRYVRINTNENNEQITLLGYIYPKHVNISLDGRNHVGRGIVYLGKKPRVLANMDGLKVEYIT